MKRLGAAAVLILVALPLAGCGNAGAETPQGTTQVQQGPSVKAFLVPLPDGRQAVCVWAEGYNRAGLSCDFGGAR